MANYSPQDAVRGSGELHEGNRLIVSTQDRGCVTGSIMQDCQNSSCVKRLPQHATRIGIVQRQRYKLPPRAITGMVRYPCYLHIGLIE